MKTNAARILDTLGPIARAKPKGDLQ